MLLLLQPNIKKTSNKVTKLSRSYDKLWEFFSKYTSVNRNQNT